MDKESSVHHRGLEDKTYREEEACSRCLTPCVEAWQIHSPPIAPIIWNVPPSGRLTEVELFLSRTPVWGVRTVVVRMLQRAKMDDVATSTTRPQVSADLEACALVVPFSSYTRGSVRDDWFICRCSRSMLPRNDHPCDRALETPSVDREPSPIFFLRSGYYIVQFSLCPANVAPAHRLEPPCPVHQR